MIGGVCMALAQANGWDVATVRILTVIGFFVSSGLVGVAYVAAWIGIPEETMPYPGVYPPRI
jgi:phage shock protein PspC (stress-responsive transcriptional regulator)